MKPLRLNGSQILNLDYRGTLYWSGPVLFDYLAKKKKFNPKLILQARKINEDMANYHAGKILKKLKRLN